MEKWARLNPDEDVDVPADMTRLTLDTIALCGFGYRFNSFYRDTPHPFVDAMVRTLLEAQNQARRLPIQNRLNIRAQRQVEEDQAFMDDLVGRLIVERREQGDAADNTDMLGRMLTGVDKQSGEKLPDENIRAQCVTFLIAGHETTSGLLSFAVYYLMKNPDCPAAGARRGRRGARQHRDADVRAGAPAALHQAGARRVTAALANGSRLHPLPLGRHRHRRPVRDPRPHAAHRAQHGAAPPDLGLGTGRRGLQPGPHGRGAGGGAAPERLQALRHRATGVHRPAVRAAGGRARARHARAALRADRPPRLPAQDQDDTHHQARRVPDPGPAAGGRPARHHGGTGADRRRGDPRCRAGRPERAAGRRARDAAVGAVRVEPRRGGGDRHPAGAGGHRARVPRHARRARRPRRRPPGGGRDRRVLVLQRDPARQRGSVLPVDPHRRPEGRRRPRVHGVRLRQHRVGQHLPGRAHAARRRAGGARRPPRAPAGRGRRRRGLRRPVPRLARWPLDRPRRRAGPPGRGRRSRRRRGRGCRSR